MLQVFTTSIFITLGAAKCAFRVNQTGFPQKVDRQPFLVQGMTQCLEYNGKMGCCDSGNNIQQQTSYVQIDGIFGSLADGCDICAINLKRLWCEYACSPRQSDFVQIKDGYEPIVDPRKPDQTIMVQKLNFTVQAQTACDIFDSCKRNGFVSSVSAMSTPAGFLTFQGHNAGDDSHQDMNFTFSYSKNDSLYFSDEVQQQSGKALTKCNYKTSNDTIHSFPFLKNCTCNACEQSCNKTGGFTYTKSSVLQGFNYVLVGSVWAFSVAGAIGITVYRNKKQKINKNC